MNLHSKQISFLGFFFFKLFICPPRKKTKSFDSIYLLKPHQGTTMNGMQSSQHLQIPTFTLQLLQLSFSSFEYIVNFKKVQGCTQDSQISGMELSTKMNNDFKLLSFFEKNYFLVYLIIKLFIFWGKPRLERLVESLNLPLSLVSQCKLAIIYFYLTYVIVTIHFQVK